ncbi:uncharacterized protein LOC143267791 isoform X1 [Peromyscus maniculatus bairdii]|uniref:uncharacterized protein LOC143267791 isoform X1 n=1 Tax=Peromyscus maniculatus bairdii TaxID=230844 RepID=UPI003FD46CD3
MWQGHAGGAGDGVGEGPPPGRRPAAMCHDRLRPNMGKVTRGQRHPWTPSHPAPSVTTPPTAPEGPAAPAAAPKQRRMSSCFLPNCRSPTRKAGQSSEALVQQPPDRVMFRPVVSLNPATLLPGSRMGAASSKKENGGPERPSPPNRR